MRHVLAGDLSYLNGLPESYVGDVGSDSGIAADAAVNAAESQDASPHLLSHGANELISVATDATVGTAVSSDGGESDRITDTSPTQDLRNFVGDSPIKIVLTGANAIAIVIIENIRSAAETNIAIDTGRSGG